MAWWVQAVAGSRALSCAWAWASFRRCALIRLATCILHRILLRILRSVSRSSVELDTSRSIDLRKPQLRAPVRLTGPRSDAYTSGHTRRRFSASERSSPAAVKAQSDEDAPRQRLLLLAKAVTLPSNLRTRAHAPSHEPANLGRHFTPQDILPPVPTPQVRVTLAWRVEATLQVNSQLTCSVCTYGPTSLHVVHLRQRATRAR